MNQSQVDDIERGCVELINKDELLKKLSSSRALRVKLGCDPTAPDIHLGHYVALRKLRDFQEWGHHIHFLIGDFTARIGDPSGKNKTRPPLSDEEIKKNAETYKEQIFKVLDPEKTKVVFNSQWCDALSAKDLIVLASRMNVARMLEREDFKKRYQEGTSIALHEFLYPLIQAYDSVAIRADIEVGGQDQRFNLLVGREIQKHYGQEEQVLLLLPLLEGTDGHEKMSKSLGNAIGIQEPARQMFGKLMSIPDSLIEKYFQNLTRIDMTEVKKWVAGNPRDAKLKLAKTMVSQFHGKEAGTTEERYFLEQFSQRKLPADEEITETILRPEQPLALSKYLVQQQILPSNAEARRLFSQGSVRSDFGDGESLQKLELDISTDQLPTGSKIKIGKRRWIKMR